MEPSKHGILATARALAADSVAAEAVRALDAVGVEAVVLKGPSTAQWLYAGGPARGYGDVDLLVDPARLRSAEAVLSRMGFVPAEPDDWPGSEYQPHARAWRRARDEAVIDLHRTLPGLRGVGPEDAWQILRGHHSRLSVGGRDVAVLDEPGRLLLIALHVQHHTEAGQRGDRPREDLRRALTVAGDDAWAVAVDLAARLNALPIFAAGLQSVPEGADAAQRMPALKTTLAAADSRDPLAYGIWRLMDARGLRARTRIVLHELLPSPSYVRYSSRLARRGRAGLVLAYLRRAGWLLRRLPSGYRAYRRRR